MKAVLVRIFSLSFGLIAVHAFGEDLGPCGEDNFTKAKGCYGSRVDDGGVLRFAGVYKNLRMKNGFWTHRQRVYIGPFYDGYPEGSGLLIDFRDKSISEGYYVNQKMTRVTDRKQMSSLEFCPDSKFAFKNKCFGELVEDGTYYIGEFKADVPHGKGFYFSRDGYYEGNFIRGSYSGSGTYYYSSGAKYEGQFKDDMLSGKGEMLFYNGTRYLGSFLNDQPHGQGTLIYNDGSVWSGQFVQGKRANGELFDSMQRLRRAKEMFRATVERLQLALIESAYLLGEADGIPGPNTYGAMRAAAKDIDQLSLLYAIESFEEDPSRVLELVESEFIKPEGNCGRREQSNPSLCFSIRN
jgi:hypothetical protein